MQHIFYYIGFFYILWTIFSRIVNIKKEKGKVSQQFLDDMITAMPSQTGSLDTSE